MRKIDEHAFAYTGGVTDLYRIWPDEGLNEKIGDLAHIFAEHIIDKKSNHLDLFFDEEWHVRSGTVSYGHDIEAAWVIRECADITGNAELLQKTGEQATKQISNYECQKSSQYEEG